MADVKVPALLHKRPPASQKAWYKKHGMEMPGHLTGGEGKSAAQAKKDVGEINKAKAKKDRLKVIAAAAKKVAQPSSDRVRAMRQNADQFGGGLGGGLDRNRDIMSYVRSGGYIKAGRLGEGAEQMDEGKKGPFAAFSSATAAEKEAAAKQVDAAFSSAKAAVAPSVKKGELSAAKAAAEKFAARSLKRNEEVEQVDEKVYQNKTTGEIVGSQDKPKPPVAPIKKPQSSLEKLRARMDASRKPKVNEARVVIHTTATDMDDNDRHITKLKDAARSLKRNEEVEQVEEAKVDYREFATAGIMHPDMAHAPRMKTGNMTDFYSRNSGDKLHGKILSNDKKTVRIEHEGKVHKFDVRRSMPTSMYKEDKDDREYGYEGDMAMSQLKSIIANAQRLHDMLEPETDLPEWVQSKITLAEDYVVTATNYCAGELDEEVVVEGSEGKTPETETEVNLAKKHGDPNKITYGDVIKARIQSAKNKALKKGD